MIRLHNACGKAILMCLISRLVGVIHDAPSALRPLPIDEEKEVLIPIIFIIVIYVYDWRQSCHLTGPISMST